MAQRLLARLYQAGATTAVNWFTQATETYSSSDPADSPSTWGTETELGYLDRDFNAVGNEKTHLGLLATFQEAPDRAFYGAVVKVRPTYTGAAAPFLELWTLKDTTWTIRRRVAVTAIARSGDTVIVDLTFAALFAADNEMPDAVWITLNTATDVSLTWIACHLYGDCTLDPVTPDCPVGTDPEDCDAPECGVELPDWVCAPLPVPPELPPVSPFPFPAILVNVTMPETYTFDTAWAHECPAPTTIRMYFGELPTGGDVEVTLVDAGGLVFAEGVSQTINAAGVMDWTISSGFGKSDPAIGSGSALGYLPPRAVTDHVTFSFVRHGADPLTLLDILVYFWTYDLVYDELCYTDGPPTDPLPAADDPPDDAAEAPATYTRVYERWLVYADTQANATAARDAHAARIAELARRNIFLHYGLSRIVVQPGIPSDADLFREALARTEPYLWSGFDENSCSSANTTNIPLNFEQLADGHIITLRVYVVPVGLMLDPRVTTKGGGLIPQYRLNPFRTASKILPYNPTPNVDTVVCSPGTDPNDTQTGDLNQRFRVFRDFNIAPQIEKWAGVAIQVGAYHLERGVTELEAFDTIELHPQPVPTNPFATTWTPPCVPPGLGRCHQWFNDGYAYLVTIRVYEPTATPLGGTVTVDPTGSTPSTASGRVRLSAVTELDATWP